MREEETYSGHLMPPAWPMAAPFALLAVGFTLGGLIACDPFGKLVALLAGLAFVALSLAPATLAGLMGDRRPLGPYWAFALGLCLGWLGVLVVSLYPPYGAGRGGRPARERP